MSSGNASPLVTIAFVLAAQDFLLRRRVRCRVHGMIWESRQNSFGTLSGRSG